MGTGYVDIVRTISVVSSPLFGVSTLCGKWTWLPATVLVELKSVLRY